ncbi:MAG: prolipoprotein diacylglyceryl transferase [Candidatus Thiothrix singaporensis]|uniref:Phosphatidylglycerol--prolipoprotein diacylglyceryl transferase n=1 Tax=Candidatus Thiothrix singaporensis TaxID=2799669 RepID=A0A7L6AXE0_9GAMM|nr:MAG: prolipoprotein diacylglyceryl transferase [Candidatus Thiothrix singaporensis]
MSAIFHWQFDPILVSIGGISVHWYGVLFATAFMSGYWIVQRICRDEGQTQLDLDNLLFYIMGGTILGARLAHCLIYDPEFYLTHPLNILKIWEGGLASHGGAVGLLLGLWLYARALPLPSLLWLTDRIAIPSALGGMLVRCANFLNSEIVGNPTNGSWGVVFEAVDELPRHPVQLYEAAAYLLIFLSLLAVYRRYGKNTPHGLLTGIFFASVFAARFVLEYFKTPQAAYEEGFSISVGQWLSVPFCVAGLGLIAYALRSPRQALGK